MISLDNRQIYSAPQGLKTKKDLGTFSARLSGDISYQIALFWWVLLPCRKCDVSHDEYEGKVDSWRGTPALDLVF